MPLLLLFAVKHETMKTERSCEISPLSLCLQNPHFRRPGCTGTLQSTAAQPLWRGVNLDKRPSRSHPYAFSAFLQKQSNGSFISNKTLHGKEDNDDVATLNFCWQAFKLKAITEPIHRQKGNPTSVRRCTLQCRVHCSLQADASNGAFGLCFVISCLPIWGVLFWAVALHYINCFKGTRSRKQWGAQRADALCG